MSARPTDVGLQRVTQAFGAFLACLDAGLHPKLSSEVMTGTNWREGEFDVVISRSELYGVLHEQIEAALKIAVDHGGRLWLDRRDGNLAILFTPPRAYGPIDDDGPTPNEKAEHAARPKRRAKAVAE